MQENEKRNRMSRLIAKTLGVFYLLTFLKEKNMLGLNEPRQANLCLRAFRHDTFQLRMPSHSEGPGIWLSV